MRLNHHQWQKQIKTMLLFVCMCFIVQYHNVWRFLLQKQRPQTQRQETFGFCESGGPFAGDGNVTCTPCLMTVSKVSGMAVESAFQAPFWGQVRFEPVPAFVINTHDPVEQDVFISGSVHKKEAPWDAYIWDLIVRVSALESEKKKKGLIVDVGANLGYFSLMAASLGHGVVAFEPMNRNVVKFYSSIVRNDFGDRVEVYQNAVGPRSGERVRLAATHHTNQGNGKIVVWDGGAGVYGEDYVETVALSDVVREDVLLLKIDVEGFESGVVDGSRRLLCEHIVKFVTMEFSPDTRANKVCSARKMVATMISLGYVISDVIANAVPLRMEDMDTFPPNILFQLQDWTQPPNTRPESSFVCDTRLKKEIL